MSLQLSGENTRQSLAEHVAAKGEEVHLRYPRLGWSELLHLLDNRNFVRYPCDLIFEAGGLQPGEFAHAEPKGDRPEDGFRMLVHPRFENDLEQVPLLVLYHLVTVNYGDFASGDDAEAYGAAALGMNREDYYAAVCVLADKLEPVGGRGTTGQDKKC